MMKRAFLFVFLVIAGVWSFSQDIVQWRGPERNGIYPETGLLKSWPADGPELVWHYEGLGQGHASAAVAGDRIYTTGTLAGTGYIFCFSQDGKLLWKVSYGEEWIESWPGSRSTPLVYEGKLYMLSGTGRLACFSADDGKNLWSVNVLSDYDGINIKWGMTENLLIDGDKLFCTSGGRKDNVICLDRNTGKHIWSSPGNGEVSAYCSPALIKLPKRTVLVTHTANSILGIDAADGRLLWSHPQPNKWSVHANTPYYRDGYLYCMSGYGQGGVMLKIAFDGSAKQEVWRNPSPDNKMGGFVVLNDVIYGSGDMKKAWYGIDWKTGKTLFADETLLGKGNIISADGMLYCYSDEGEVALLKPISPGLQKVSSFRVPYGEDQHWAHLVIAGGRLYVRHGSSLMVYDIRL